MARPLNSTDFGQDDVEETDAASSRVDRAAARAFAAAVSALIISTLVVSQSSAAIDPDGTVAGNSIEVGTVSLTDDDLGRSLLALEAMAPGRPIQECITVTYDGTILPVELTLDTQTVGDLGPFLDVSIERGVGGGFGDCGDFEPTASVFTGTLGELDRKGAMGLGFIYNSDESSVFRFEFELQDEADAVGRKSSIDFVWEATP